MVRSKPQAQVDLPPGLIRLMAVLVDIAKAEASKAVPPERCETEENESEKGDW